MKRIQYLIPLRITAYVTGERKDEIEISFEAWKHGIVSSKNLLTDKTMTRVGNQNTAEFGETFYRKVKEMAYKDLHKLD